MKQTLLLIDGNSIINRAYFGLAGRSTMSAADGTPTGALYAFMNIYLKHIQDLNPTFVCACFDLKTPTFRHLEYSRYKETRKPMPPDLARQIPVLKEILDAMGVPRMEMEGYEADDLIGSLSKYSAESGWDTYILSGDKDDLQLVDENTIVLMPLSKNGQTTTQRFDIKAVEEKYQIKPEQFIDLKALMGDPSDNIPGVKGIGEKGATELIMQYQSLDAIYQSLDQIKPAIAEKLQISKETAYLSKRLATIKRDIPVRDFLQEIPAMQIDKEKTYQILHRLGFRSIISRLMLAVPEPEAKKTSSFQTEMKGTDSLAVKKEKEPILRKVSGEELAAILQKAVLYQFPKKSVNVSEAAPFGDLDNFITKTVRDMVVDSGRGFLSFLPVTEDLAIFDCGDEEFYLIEQPDFEEFFKILKKEKIYLASMESKLFLRKQKINAHHLLVFDIFVAGYLLSQTEGKPTLERVAQANLGELSLETAESETRSENRQQSFFEEKTEDAAEENAKVELLLSRASCGLALIHPIVKEQYTRLESMGLLFLALQVEMPLVGILAGMEDLGFKIDQTVLTQLNEEMTQKAADIEKSIYDMCGTAFNINSPKQLGDILFKKLALPTGRKTQNGYSTDSDVLDMLYDKHPVIKEIIEYRQLTKLRSTFVEGLSKNIDPADQRVHTTFNQTLTTTGRLSSSEPNLQNIPVKQEVGREIRKAFVASAGNILIDADYSQIELRLLAELSKDEEMLEAFRQNDDIHMNTAEEIFDMPRSMITKSMRSAAKTVNFSIVYGISDFGLARDLGVTLKEAHSYISEYYKKYPGVKIYLEGLVKEAYSRGYVETLFHRRRNIHELKSANRNIRMFGERVAMNTPVQGTAADIIKIAMVLVAKKLSEAGYKARLVLQVHDELILEAPHEEAAVVSILLKESMEEAVKLSIPFIAEVKIGKDWYQAK